MTVSPQARPPAVHRFGAPAPDGAALWCVRLGLVDYGAASELQERLERARLAGAVPDLLLLLEHPPVYTRGRRSEPGELPMGEEWYRLQGIDVVETDRGGRVTYHGPGQLVGYPIMSLRPYGDDVHDYVGRMERVIIDALGTHGVVAGLAEGLTGVWARAQAGPSPGRKIASIGVHVSRGITRHGFAINVNNDLQPFEWVVPCGIDHCRMTSVACETGRAHDMGAFMDVVASRFGSIYGRRPVDVSPAELAERAGTPDPEPAGAVAA